jgi:GNAT superfamily N-acetyltransferase
VTTVAKQSPAAIRAPRFEDFARMAELASQLGYSTSHEEMERRVAAMQASDDHGAFVAELPNGDIVGWIGVFVYRCLETDPRAEINGIVVDENARSLGIGSRLMARAEEWAREKECKTVGVRSNVNRERAHTFYERLGYKHFKTQKSFRKDL